jgi:hypothetical protein
MKAILPEPKALSKGVVGVTTLFWFDLPKSFREFFVSVPQNSAAVDV